MRSDRLSLTGPLLLADWGTTSRRAWLLDARGKVVAAAEDPRGMATIEPGGCVIGTRTGFVDARITTQLAEVRRALAEVVEDA